ncbi:MAG: hypothetical protein ACI9VS_001640 [Candidatus Binatia bacterium]|jgi:hypothetical protein
MISLGVLFIAIFAAAIPVTWLFVVKWFLSKDAAETEQLDQFELSELTNERKAAKSATGANLKDSHLPDLTHAGAH